MVENLADFTPEAREVAEEEIRRRYLTAHVEAITGVRTEFGVTYWHVTTDKGPRDFVVQSMSEAAAWLSDSHVLITDVDGNRFEFPDLADYDHQSIERLASVL